MGPSRGPHGSMSRRGFLLGSGLGLAAGAGGTWALLNWLQRQQRDALPSFRGRTQEDKKPQFAMPGPYPGRVIEVRHRDSVTPANEIHPETVKAMMARGMTELTGADHPLEAWRRLFQKGDVVGIKVNPVGRGPKPGDGRNAHSVGAISSPAVLLEIVASLRAAGVRPQDIILYERYANEFREAGYEALMTERIMDGTRWYASGAGYDDGQLDIEGYDTNGARRDLDPHVVGYDPDVFVQMGFATPGYEKDERAYRSHLSMIVTRMVNKIITVPVLKDHRSAGVTLALKNLSHGHNNNVARSHIPTTVRISGATSGPNQCNTFIPTAVNQLPTREKATLHILDGLIGVYEGGPGCWNWTWGTWQRKSLFFATDPVAMDHVGWDIVDAKRAQEGWQPVAAMGTLQQPGAVGLSARLAALAGGGAPQLASSALLGRFAPGLQDTEAFDRRQPEHILLAGTIGLGTFDADKIEHRVIRMA